MDKMVSKKLMNVLHEEEGYSLCLKLEEAELNDLRRVVKSHWLSRIQTLAPEHVNLFDELGIENYHKRAHFIEHDKAWLSTSRVLPKEAVLSIKQLPFYEKLRQLLGDFIIADEEKLGWENMLWRLVRPGNTDCGPLHADKWFWDLAEDWFVPDHPHDLINIWIAVHTISGKNGLLVIPHSQTRDDWKWHDEVRHGRRKPIFDEDLSCINVELLPTIPGQAVLFSNKLIHGGAPNLAQTTRVSLEFTIIVPK